MPTAAAVVSTENFIVAPIAPCRTPSIDMGLDLGLGSSVSSSGSVDSPLPFIGRFSFDLNDTELKYAVFCFVKNYVGAAGGNSVAIDNRIVQALDIVKDRLIHAVREEVDELKLKIEELNLRIRELESENSILRGAVPSELLAQIDSQKPGGGQN